jgi:2-polyprenyl-3-methyl-5-hydroxy-6-metoxy-1,4-benzoquinol methylase
VFLANVPADLARFYSRGYYGFDASGEPPWRKDPFLRQVEAYRVAALCRHVRPGRLIEIGAGAGGFAAAGKDAGFEVTAVEMDGRCCDYLSERVGVEVIHSDQPLQALCGSAPVRVVAMWHVLEHLPNPQEVLQAAAERLEPGGLLAIGVPNPSSLQFRLLRARWVHLDAPRHLCLTPAQALIDQGRELGLSTVEMTTADPFGHHCNVHGWTYALKRRPGRGPAPAYSRPGVAMTRLMQPLEGHGHKGSALLVLLRKSGAGHVREHG